MAYYENKIDDALKFLLRHQLTNPMGDKPIVYVVYDPSDAIEMENILNSVIMPKVKFWGFKTIDVIRMGKVIDEAIKSSKNLKWYSSDRFKEKMLFKGIAKEITDSKCMSNIILDKQKELTEKEKPLIIISELEMLHPFERIGSFENDHYNDIQVPMLILYPGTSKVFARSLLSVNEMDRSYRSKNF